MNHYHACNKYLDARQGTYEFRRQRYGLIADRLLMMGLSKGDVICDIGAGRCEMGRYLRERFPDLDLVYIAFDGAIDGVDLEVFRSPIEVDFHVAVEFIEHLLAPEHMLRHMWEMSRKGIAITTPNAEAVDVLAMDETHKTPITTSRLLEFGMTVEPLMMFTDNKLDTIVAWMDCNQTAWGHVKAGRCIK